MSTFSEATHLAFSSSHVLPKSTPTRIRKPGATSTDPQDSPQDFISLGAVYLAWLLRDAPSAEYMKQVRENGLASGFISVTERKGLVDWLHNRTQTLSGLITVEREFSFRLEAWVSSYPTMLGSRVTGCREVASTPRVWMQSTVRNSSQTIWFIRGHAGELFQSHPHIAS